MTIGRAILPERRADGRRAEGKSVYASAFFARPHADRAALLTPGYEF